MAGKATKSSIPSTSTNKDLSCLRCRKKKAKCSKTRPQCTRCARSNQPCEYPDAPPNLTDLSQKVLTLYDTLRELEGEFLVKYMQSLSNDIDDDERDEKVDTLSIVTPQPDTIEPKRQKKEEDISTQEPGGWSMSLTPTGLSIHAVTRNLAEFHEFTKSISSQIMRDFGPSYLPKNWDPDAEGYFENSDIDDDLDEDEYLVTVPVISTKTLLFNNIEREPQAIEGSHTLIPSHYPHMIQHLHLRYQWLEQDEPHAGSPHHLVILMHQLKLYLPPHSSTDMTDALSQICILTAYVISVTLLPPIPNAQVPEPPHVHDCSEYATLLLVDLVLQKGDQIPCYPIILCAVLLAWIDTELNSKDSKADAMIHTALRVLCGSNWQSEEPAWQILIASLLYLDVYSATFRFKKPQLRGDGIQALWKAAVQMREPNRWHASYQEAGIVLEARLMALLNKVITLFYQDAEVNVRKIDVDEVLTLVRDIELWEQELPEWAKWSYELTKEEMPRLGLKMHMHMIHNMVKILLFRPLCTSSNEEQTYTKTIFLDMSTSSADRLTKCLLHVEFTEFWTTAASNLVRDVSARVLNMFNSDEDIVNQLDVIQKRLEKAESIKKEI